MTTDKDNNRLSVGGQPEHPMTATPPNRCSIGELKATLRDKGHTDYLLETPGRLAAFVEDDYHPDDTTTLYALLQNIRPPGVEAQVYYLSGLNAYVSGVLSEATTLARADGRMTGFDEGRAVGFDEGADHMRLRNRAWRIVAAGLDRWRCRHDRG